MCVYVRVCVWDKCVCVIVELLRLFCVEVWGSNSCRCMSCSHHWNSVNSRRSDDLKHLWQGSILNTSYEWRDRVTSLHNLHNWLCPASLCIVCSCNTRNVFVPPTDLSASGTRPRAYTCRKRLHCSTRHQKENLFDPEIFFTQISFNKGYTR